MRKLNHPLTGPSGHLSPCQGEKSRGFDDWRDLAAVVPLPRAGREVARRAGEGVVSGHRVGVAKWTS